MAFLPPPLRRAAVPQCRSAAVCHISHSITSTHEFGLYTRPRPPGRTILTYTRLGDDGQDRRQTIHVVHTAPSGVAVHTSDMDGLTMVLTGHTQFYTKIFFYIYTTWR